MYGSTKALIGLNVPASNPTGAPKALPMKNPTRMRCMLMAMWVKIVPFEIIRTAALPTTTGVGKNNGEKNLLATNCQPKTSSTKERR